MKLFKQERPHWCGPAALVALQVELGLTPYPQSAWAQAVGTTSKGTSVAAIKRGIRMIHPRGVCVVRKTSYPFAVGILHDPDRDHWMTARCRPPPRGTVMDSRTWVVKLIDPEDGSVTRLKWPDFQARYLNTVKKSYVLCPRSSQPQVFFSVVTPW